jgi:hypothetical protein
MARERVAASVCLGWNDAGRRRQIEALASSLPLTVHAFVRRQISRTTCSADVRDEPGGLTVSEARPPPPDCPHRPDPRPEANARFLVPGAASRQQITSRRPPTPPAPPATRSERSSAADGIAARPNAAPDAVKRFFRTGRKKDGRVERNINEAEDT